MNAANPDVVGAGKVRPPVRWLGRILIVLVLLTALLGGVGYLRGYKVAKAWVESSAGRRVASRGLSRAIKVDGNFQPLHVEGWTIQTDSFTGPGWPGEALGEIDAYQIRAEFDPSAFFRHAWRITGIQIDRATIQLKPPNDALKRPVPPKQPRPWYAFFLPDHFECGPIVAQHAELEFNFQKQTAHIHEAHVQADLIGKDLKYTATSGVLDFPYLPPLRILRLEMMVTRPLITISTAQLAGIDPQDPARLSLSGKLGMRENKAIDATVEVVQMPIEQILPENLKSLIHGRASGQLVWNRDSTGQQVFSEGNLTIMDGRIDDLSVFRQLALLHDNPDLKDFLFDQATCHFKLQDGVCTLDLRARCAGKFDISGKISYELATKVASLDVSFDELPLQTWLPPDLKAQSSGVAKANLKWRGQLDTIKNSAGTVAINLDHAQIRMPDVIRRALAPRHLRAPDRIEFQKADLNIDYRDQTFQLTRGDLVLPKILNAQLSGSLSPGTTLNAAVDWQGLTIEDWLPEEVADQFSGDMTGRATMQVTHWKLANGSYAGEVTLLRGELRYTFVQSMLARFTKDRRLLEIPLTRAHFFWSWDRGNLTVNGIDLRGGDELGVQGELHMKANKELTGLLWIGTKPVYLKPLAEVANAVFTRRSGGLAWARVAVSGTTRKPQQDLSSQVVTQLKRHPFVAIGLGLRLVSWYAGNLFGAADEWKRPKP